MDYEKWDVATPSTHTRSMSSSMPISKTPTRFRNPNVDPHIRSQHTTNPHSSRRRLRSLYSKSTPQAPHHSRRHCSQSPLGSSIPLLALLTVGRRQSSYRVDATSVMRCCPVCQLGKSQTTRGRERHTMLRTLWTAPCASCRECVGANRGAFGARGESDV